MKVSIIIPCYNSATYLEACLETVLNQTMQDFEVLLIDDGSSDDTLAIARRIAQSDARVRVWAQANAGVSAARNRGLDHAQGTWVTFVDSDDLLPEDALETLLSGATDETDMVVCPHETFDETGRTEVVVPDTKWMILPPENRKRAIALRLIEGDTVLNIMCGKLHRRAYLERNRLRLIAGLKIAEDALFNLEATLEARSVTYVGRVAYRYRTHQASAMHTQTQSEWMRHEPWLIAMRDRLIAHGVMEQYWGAWVDSAALRLYKDGGVGGVMRGFNRKVGPLLPTALSVERMNLKDRWIEGVCRKGRYPVLYPWVYPVQVIRRKMKALCFAWRMRKERPMV